MNKFKRMFALLLLAMGLIVANTAEAFTCGDATQLVGVWFGVINGMASKSIQECSIRVDTSKKLTGSCVDIHNKKLYKIKSGSIKLNNQCLVTFTINFTNRAIATSRAVINKAGDTMIGTYKNSFGDYGSFSSNWEGG